MPPFDIPSAAPAGSSGPGPEPTREDVVRAIDALVEECRVRCLWYLRRDYLPRTDSDRVEILEAIQQRADLGTYRRAGALKAWLSRTSSAGSVSS
jgi:hypothetical protein